MRSCGFGVFVDYAFFHHKQDVFRQANILEGIAGNGHDIGELAGFERANLVRQAEQVSVSGGPGLQRGGWFHAEVDHLVKLFGVAAVGIDGGVRAEPDLYPFGQRALKCGMHGVNRQVRLGRNRRRNVNVAIKLFLKALGGHQCGDKVGPPLLHHVQVFLVEEAAMLDGIDAGTNGAFGGFRSVGVRGGFAMKRMSFVDQRGQFLLRELRRVDIVCGREDAAGGADLNNVRAIFVIEAHRVASLIRTIDDAVERAGLTAEDACAKTVLIVAVTAGRTERTDTDEHARTGNVAVRDGIAKADIDVIGRADVADSSETGHKRDARVDAGVQGALGDGLLQALKFGAVVVVRKRKAEMRVGVDEAGKKRSLAQIDDFRARGDSCTWTDAADPPARYDDEPGSDQRVALAVEHRGGPQNISFRGRLLFLRVNVCPENYTDEKYQHDSCAHEVLSLWVEVSVDGRLYPGWKKVKLWRAAGRSKFNVKSVPPMRIRKCNQAPLRPDANYVLYWMIASRRLRYNFALDRALEHCRALHKPLLIFEALRVDYPWASDRLHRFVLDGMAANARYCQSRRIRYLAYVEPAQGAGKGLLRALAEDACVVVTDEFPCFFLPRMVASAAQQLKILLEQVDSNGLLPLRAAERLARRAVDFRRHLQKELPAHLEHFPHSQPLAVVKLPKTPELCEKILTKWPMASDALLAGQPQALARLPIDHSVARAEMRGGQEAARNEMQQFFSRKFALYAEHRNEPDMDVASGFSPFLHFGHLSVHEVFSELAKREKWGPEKLAVGANGSREGWWNMSPAAEGFLDELITWREIGYNFASHRKDYDQYESLPEWARQTLKEHAKDEREWVYSLQEFETAATHDSLWNAAQTQLVRQGRMHNYIRMLWGKKILEWSRTPQEAAKTMIQLNNKYALDGRNPNSYSGIFWVLGRYDRPWGPERQIFGKIRYMSSQNTARKVSVEEYIGKYGGAGSQQGRCAF